MAPLDLRTFSRAPGPPSRREGDGRASVASGRDDAGEVRVGELRSGRRAGQRPGSADPEADWRALAPREIPEEVERFVFGGRPTHDPVEQHDLEAVWEASRDGFGI